MIAIVKTVRTTKRPSVNIPFYQWSDSFISYTEENYVTTGKLIAYKIELSDDGLTEIRTSTWSSYTSYNSFVLSAPGLAEWQTREAYQRANGITGTLEDIPLEVNSIDEITSVSTINLRN